MAEICYEAKKFNADHERIITNANAICGEYFSQGLVLTLRQLYYQFVARGLMANRQQNYDKLGRVVADARMAGRIDWSYLIDRTRNEISRSRWDNPGTLLEQAAAGYHIDLWKGQGVRPIVFVEKDAAIGVIESVCHDNDVSYLSCRGYMSASELWNAAQRIRYHIENGERVVILHIGDHDPSGLDMTRDIRERLNRFIYKDWSLLQGAELPFPRTYGDLKMHMLDYMNTVREREGVKLLAPCEPFVVRRIALNWNQIQEYDPPPNPAKATDVRFEKYVADTGSYESWELDALEPNVLIALIQDELDGMRDDDMWGERVLRMEMERQTLQNISNHYTPVVKFVGDLMQQRGGRA